MRRIFCLFLLLFLLTGLALTASAQEQRHIVDEAELLSEVELETLEAKAQAISQRYGCGVYLRIIPNYRTMYVGDMEQTAQFIFLQEDLGTGPDRDGILLLLSMNQRDYWLATHGSAMTSFTDYGLAKLETAFCDDFGEDDWYGGAWTYLTQCERLLDLAQDGTPLDVGTDSGTVIGAVVISLLLGVLISTVVCLSLRGGMRSVRSRGAAGDYVTAREIIHRSDRLIHISRIRHKIETNTSSNRRSGGGGSGGSFGGRGGKF